MIDSSGGQLPWQQSLKANNHWLMTINLIYGSAHLFAPVLVWLSYTKTCLALALYLSPSVCVCRSGCRTFRVFRHFKLGRQLHWDVQIWNRKFKVRISWSIFNFLQQIYIFLLQQIYE